MKLLTKEQITEVAEKLNILPELLFAIDKVESAGCGFYTSGKYSGELKTLMEGHYFSKFTKKKYDKTHPTLSYPKWIKGVTTKFYREGSLEFGRFLEAFELDKRAAQLSTSWARYQICGFNFEKAGYKNVVEMILDYYEGGEPAQFKSFLTFCDNTISKFYKISLLELLIKYSETKDENYLENFIRHYNGSGQIPYYKKKILKFMKLYKK